MDRRSAMEHQQFQRAQSTSRPADARQRGTSTGGGGSSFNPFSHSGQGTYSDPYQRAGVGGSISETVTATTVASDSDLAFLSGGGKPKYDVPVTHNPQYGVTSTSRGNANSGRTTSRAGSTGPLTIGTQRTSRFARSGAQGLASARQINSGGVFGNSGGGGGWRRWWWWWQWTTPFAHARDGRHARRWSRHTRRCEEQRVCRGRSSVRADESNESNKSSKES